MSIATHAVATNLTQQGNHNAQAQPATPIDVVQPSRGDFNSRGIGPPQITTQNILQVQGTTQTVADSYEGL